MKGLDPDDVEAGGMFIHAFVNFLAHPHHINLLEAEAARHVYRERSIRLTRNQPQIVGQQARLNSAW